LRLWHNNWSYDKPPVRNVRGFAKIIPAVLRVQKLMKRQYEWRVCCEEEAWNEMKLSENLIVWLYCRIEFFLSICLFPHTKSIVQTHTLCTTQIDKNRQNRTLYNGIWAGGITGLQTLFQQSVLQRRWRQNHKITDTYLTLLFANQWHWCNTTAEQDVNSWTGRAQVNYESAVAWHAIHQTNTAMYGHSVTK